MLEYEHLVAIILKQAQTCVNACLDAARHGKYVLLAWFKRDLTRRTLLGLQAFLAAFNHISTEIDKIYKELTRSSMHPLGE